MLKNQKNKVLFSKKDRGFLCDTGSSCFEWIVEHEQTTYKEDDGQEKTSDWWEVYLSFSDSYRTISIFNCMHEDDLKTKLAVAKTVRKSLDNFINALEEAVKSE